MRVPAVTDDFDAEVDGPLTKELGDVNLVRLPTDDARLSAVNQHAHGNATIVGHTKEEPLPPTELGSNPANVPHQA